LGGVGGSWDVTRSTNPDSDASHADNQLATSPSDAAIGCSSNAIGQCVYLDRVGHSYPRSESTGLRCRGFPRGGGGLE
jgi:hypothetical protein